MSKKAEAAEPRHRAPEFIRAVCIIPNAEGLWGVACVDLTLAQLEANVVKTFESDAKASAIGNAQQHLYDWAESYLENSL